MQNPLEVLGVPKYLVARERNQGNYDAVLRLAEAYYKALTRAYHPDLPGGDEDLMVTFAEAIAELRNPAGLQVNVDFYVDSEDMSQVARANDRQNRSARDGQRFYALVSALWNTDQFALFGTTAPISVITGIGLNDIQDNQGAAPYGTVVLDVLAHDRLEVYQAYHPLQAEVPVPMFGPPEYDSAVGGGWYDHYQATGRMGRRGMVRHHHANPRHQPGVIRAIGGADRADLFGLLRVLYGGTKAATEFVLDSILRGHPSINWAVADQSWWLGATKASVSEGDYVILMEAGREPMFTIVGPVRASAYMA